MRYLRARKPSPALVIAVLALIVALGGTAYAGITIRKNSVGTKQLKNGAVTTPKIKNGAVTTAKLGNPGQYTTASGATQSSTATPITSAAATIGNPIQIKTTGTKRLIASAAVHATNGTAGTGVYLVCRITIDGTAGVNDTAYASPAGGFTVVDASVSPLASAMVGAGTHTVTLSCSAAGGVAPKANVVDDALAGWAVSS
jgi:hypothetical protein